MKGVREFDFPRVKQIGMAGSPTYTADTALDSTNGENLLINGTISVSASGADSVTGFGTRFNDELRVGDSVSFINDSGNTETHIIEAITDNNTLTLESVNVQHVIYKNSINKKKSKITRR
jgi:hypothetical protein